MKLTPGKVDRQQINPPMNVSIAPIRIPGVDFINVQ